jgi:hypothetical protein
VPSAARTRYFAHLFTASSSLGSPGLVRLRSARRSRYPRLHPVSSRGGDLNKELAHERHDRLVPFLVLGAALAGCEQPGDQDPIPEPAVGDPDVDQHGGVADAEATRVLLTPQVEPGLSALGISSDWTGEVDIRICRCSTVTELQHQSLPCTVDPDYVLVGGGAHASCSAGALLTASFPDGDDLRTWRGSSADHISACKHSLDVYAIGLRIDGVPRESLRSHMRLEVATYSEWEFPSKPVPLPFGFTLLGGGGRVNWKAGTSGMLLDYSRPDGSRGWKSEGTYLYRNRSRGNATAFTVTAKSSCAHGTRTQGGPLVTSCDPCVFTICGADPYCCNGFWDDICVDEVRTICGQTCQ